MDENIHGEIILCHAHHKPATRRWNATTEKELGMCDECIAAAQANGEDISEELED